MVFLDIEMPKMNGFDMLEQFDTLSFDVVFCTAYDQFAIKAFHYSALNYLLKPIDPDDLISTVKRIEERKKSILPKSSLLFYCKVCNSLLKIHLIVLRFLPETG